MFMQPPPGSMPLDCTGYKYRWAQTTSADGKTVTTTTWIFSTKSGKDVEVTEEKTEGGAENVDPLPSENPTSSTLALAFKKADKNKSGSLSQKQLLACLLSLGMDAKVAREHVKDFSKLTDHHGGGTLDYVHFVDEYTRMRLFHLNKSLKTTFKEADKDKSGALDSKEAFALFERVLGKESPKSLQNLWVKMDSNVLNPLPSAFHAFSPPPSPSCIILSLF